MNAENRRNELLRQSRVSLKKKCKSLKISGEGSKTDMIDRIMRQIYGNNQLTENPQQSTQNTPEVRRKLRLQRRMQYKSSVTVKTIIIKKKQKQKNRVNSNAKNVTKEPKPKKNYLTFHFVGIRAPKSYSKSKSKSMFDNVKIQSITIKSKLLPSASISALKKFIKTTYSIHDNHDILILYSHVIISNNNDAKLKHWGITNNSLLTLAISRDKISTVYDPYTHHHLFRSVKQTRESVTFEMQKGFDIITQEQDTDVYKMPICGHLMSKQSLYHYAMSAFMDQSNLFLTCPHTKNHGDDYKYEQEQKYGGDYSGDGAKWSCPQCTYISRGHSKCTMCGHQKPELIMSSGSTNQCKTIWHYSLIKQILAHKPSTDNQLDAKDNFNNFNIAKLELLSARNKLENTNDKKLNLQKCYECNTLYFKNKPQKTIKGLAGYKKLKTKCLLCCKLFCWNCGKKFVNNHMCDGSFRLQIINILKTCPLKRIGAMSNVPSIRACPNKTCAQLINHRESCKHIKCRSCQTNFCFVCMKPMISGRWQCGSHGDRCNVAPRQTLKSTINKTATVELRKLFQLF